VTAHGLPNMRALSQSGNGVFLVGCPRSGTTLLQSILASHSQVLSFPETHFFSTLIPYKPFLRRLGITTPRRANRARSSLVELGCNPYELPRGLRNVSVRSFVDILVHHLNTAARRQDKSRWLEKTPAHLHYTDIIERYIPDCHFVHLIRDGRDVVASLYEVTHKYPARWGGSRDVDQCIDRWIQDIRITCELAHRQRHTVVQYEGLTSDPKDAMIRLCDVLDLQYSENMLSSYQRTYHDIRVGSAEWTDGAGQGIYKRPREKFHKVFSEREREYVTRRINEAGLLNLSEAFGNRLLVSYANSSGTDT